MVPSVTHPRLPTRTKSFKSWMSGYISSGPEIHYSLGWQSCTLGRNIGLHSNSCIYLVNDAVIASGRPPLGFLNQWLYSRGLLGFHDITNGSAIGCDTNGFQAVPGWDAVTGFATPFFNQILPLALTAGSWST